MSEQQGGKSQNTVGPRAVLGSLRHGKRFGSFLWRSSIVSETIKCHVCQEPDNATVLYEPSFHGHSVALACR